MSFLAHTVRTGPFKRSLFMSATRYNTPGVLGYRNDTFDKNSFVKERNLTMADKLQGLKEERENEKSITGRAINLMADAFYQNMYDKKMNWVFPREFYGNPWMRYISVDGIPGSGADKLAQDLAAERELQFRDKPDLYYFFKRHNQQCQAEKALSESFKHGELGNYYEEWLNMDWAKVHHDPEDWKMASRCTGWQLRAFRLKEMDNAIDFLVGMQGVVAYQTFLSYRAEIHALGETNMFPDVMYQSFIDQFHKMRSRLMPIPVCIYLDVDPEVAHKNIKNNPNISAQEKAFYSLVGLGVGKFHVNFDTSDDRKTSSVLNLCFHST